MSRLLAIVVLFNCFSVLADFIQPEPEHFHPNGPIVWAVTNKLPSSVEIYETVQTNFPTFVFSNAIAMGSFTPLEMKSQGKDLISFESRKNSVLVRSLKISQTQGTVEYFKSKTDWSSIHDVPSFDEIRRLAFDCLQRFGADTNQVSSGPSPRTEQTVESYDKRGGTMTNKAVSARGIMLCRAIDGIDCSDSFMIEFGNDSSVAMLRMNWKYLKPHQRMKAITKSQMLDTIKAGNTVILPNMNGGEISTNAATFTITKATPIYRTKNAGTLVFPSVDFEIVSDIGQPNATTNYLECPFIRMK